MASCVVVREKLCFSRTHVSSPKASTSCRLVSHAVKSVTASSAFAFGRAPQIAVKLVDRDRRVSRTASRYGQTTSAKYDASNKYDVDESQSFRRKALARLQGLLPAQWATTKYAEEPEEDEPEEQYGMQTYGYQETSLANRTLITIRFQVHYQTYLGQELLIGGSHPSLGSWDAMAAIPMVWTPGDIWMAE
eukprot:6377803-Pyramimonas_sp.AAC.1